MIETSKTLPHIHSFDQITGELRCACSQFLYRPPFDADECWRCRCGELSYKQFLEFDKEGNQIWLCNTCSFNFNKEIK